MVPISLDIFKFLDRAKLNYENIVDKNLSIRRTFYLKNKSELPFVSAFQYKVIKFLSISEMEYVDLFENML